MDGGCFCGANHIEFNTDILQCFFCKSTIHISTETDLTVIEINQKNLQIRKKKLDLIYEQLKNEIDNIKESIRNEKSKLLKITD